MFCLCEFEGIDSEIRAFPLRASLPMLPVHISYYIVKRRLELLSILFAATIELPELVVERPRSFLISQALRSALAAHQPPTPPLVFPLPSTSTLLVTVVRTLALPLA